MVCDDRPRSRRRSERQRTPFALESLDKLQDVLVAGQHSVEFSVLDWDSDMERMVFHLCDLADFHTENTKYLTRQWPNNT